MASDLTPVDGDPENGDENSEIPEGDVEERAEHITNVVLARVEQKLEQRIEHLHLPMDMPTADQAKALKEDAPEVYSLWLELARDKAKTENEVQRKPYDQPFTLAKRGQWFGLLGMVLVLALCGYIASLGSAGLYIGGILAAIDLVAIIGTFMALRNRAEGPGVGGGSSSP